MSKHNKQTRVVRKKKRKVRKLSLILVPLIVLFIAVGCYIGYLYITTGNVLSDSYEDDGREKSDLRDTVVDPDFDNVTVLIMGVDTSDVRGGAESARTDTLMLATLNKDDKSVKLLSIPRDTYTFIPEVGYEDKINHAHHYGGTKGTIDTVENLLDIPVDYYVKLNFEAFIDVVDTLNGIEVEVPYEFTEQDSKDKQGAIHLMPGLQELDGEEALALARTRKLDNDIERGKRQQQIIQAITDKAVSFNTLFKVDELVKSIGDNMTTNMTFSEMQSFVSYLTAGKALNIETLTLDGYDSSPGGTYYWYLDENALIETQQNLQAHLELPVTNTQPDLNDGAETNNAEQDNSYQQESETNNYQGSEYNSYEDEQPEQSEEQDSQW